MTSEAARSFSEEPIYKLATLLRAIHTSPTLSSYPFHQGNDFLLSAISNILSNFIIIAYETTLKI